MTFTISFFFATIVNLYKEDLKPHNNTVTIFIKIYFEIYGTKTDRCVLFRLYFGMNSFFINMVIFYEMSKVIYNNDIINKPDEERLRDTE